MFLFLVPLISLIKKVQNGIARFFGINISILGLMIGCKKMAIYNRFDILLVVKR